MHISLKVKKGGGEFIPFGIMSLKQYLISASASVNFAAAASNSAEGISGPSIL